MKLLTSCVALALCASPVLADLTVSFRDGAPKDRFVLEYTGTCALDTALVTIDVGTAPAGLIFDTTASGQGVKVFQPFELVSGADQLRTVPQIRDGDTQIALDIGPMMAGASLAFTIDVDDTTSTRQITVNGSEMAGATLRVVHAEQTESAVFDASGNATLKLDGCLS